MSGSVYVCDVEITATTVCEPRNLSREPHPATRAWCLRNPNDSSVPGSSSDRTSVFVWRCQGRNAVVARRILDTSTLDSRGFIMGEWRIVEPPRSSPQAPYLRPVPGDQVSASFFDPTYRVEESRQHLGVDLTAPAGTDVVSPVDGTVVFNRTAGVDASTAFLIIRETATGAEHVLGHINSPIQPGTVAASVTRGQRIGSIADWGRRSHVHWGLNTRGVPRSVQPGPGGDWGWGRAPVGTTRAHARERGWVEVDTASTSLVAEQAAQGWITLLGSELRIDVGDRNRQAAIFVIGGPREYAIRSVTEALGPPETTGQFEECGGGATSYATWPEVHLVFTGDQLTGWESTSPRTRTEEGLAAGSSVAELRRAFPRVQFSEYTTGYVFVAGDYYGFLNGGRSRIERIRHGVNCDFH